MMSEDLDRGSETSRVRQLGRSALAVITGYAVIVVVQTGLTGVLAALWGIEFSPSTGPGREQPPTSFTLATLIVGVAVAALGGSVAARIGRTRPLLHGWLLGGVLFAGGAVYQFVQFFGGLETEGAKEPVWFLLLLPALALAGALLGAYRAGRAMESD